MGHTLIVKITGQATVEGLDKRGHVDVHALPLDALLHSPSRPLLHWSVHGDGDDGDCDDGGDLGGGDDRFPILREFSFVHLPGLSLRWVDTHPVATPPVIGQFV